MKKRLVTLIGLVLVQAAASGLDLTITQDLTNVYFSPEASETDSRFDASDWFWGTGLYIKHEVNPGFFVKSGFDWNQIGRRRIFADVFFNSDMLSLGIGPYIGLVNTGEAWSVPGLSSFFQIDSPGFGYFKTSFQSTLSPIAKTGDYYQSAQSFGLGMYVPNGIIGMGVDFERFSVMENGFVTTDDRKAIVMETEVFFKNVPLRFGVDFQFQNLSRDYTVNNSWFSIYSGMIGLHGNYTFTPEFEMFLNSKSSVLNFGYGHFDENIPALAFAPSPNSYLFQLNAGMTYKFK